MILFPIIRIIKTQVLYVIVNYYLDNLITNPYDSYHDYIKKPSRDVKTLLAPSLNSILTPKAIRNRMFDDKEFINKGKNNSIPSTYSLSTIPTKQN